MKFFTLVTNKNFIGSMVVLIFGIVTTVGALTNPNPSTDIGDSLLGLYIIVGTLVYRSAKERRLGLVESTNKRKIVELLALAILVVIFFRTQKILQYIQDGNVTNIVIVVWVIIAYLFAISTGQKKTEPSLIQRHEEK